MTYTDYGLRFLVKWKAGQGQPDLPNAYVTVSHDNATHAYSITPEELDDFKEWVLLTSKAL